MTSDESDAIDTRLLADGRLGDVLARHYDDLLARARMRIGLVDADDALQAALLRVVGEVKAGRTYPIPIRAVLHQVLTWTMREMWSSGRRRTAHLPEGWDAPDPEAADAFAEIEGTSWVEDVVGVLPPREREVMTLLIVHGLTIERIASRLGIERNAVDQALFRARKAIRESLNGG